MHSFATPYTRLIAGLIVTAALPVCGTALPLAAAESKQLRITEFMYDAEGADGGKEYIEIINTGPGDITASAVKFSEHGRTRGIRGSAVLKPGDIALIVSEPSKFSEHYPSFTGTLLDSANFSLNNTGSTLALLLNGETLHSVTYTKDNGGNGDGSAVHVGGNDSLSAQPPSPGTVRGIAVTASAPAATGRTARGTGTAPAARTTREAGTVSRETGTAPTAPAESPAHPAARITTDPERVFLASESSFTAERTGGGTVYGRWNFGDGTSVTGDTVTHAYLHPGTYIISFSEIATTGRRKRSRKPEELIQIREEITVRAPLVSAERIDGVFVRFRNDHPFTLDVSGWRILAPETQFVFPEKSFIPAGKSTAVSFVTPADTELFIATRGGGVFDGAAGAADTEPDGPAAQSAAPTQSAQPTAAPAGGRTPTQSAEPSAPASSAARSASSSAQPTASTGADTRPAGRTDKPNAGAKKPGTDGANQSATPADRQGDGASQPATPADQRAGGANMATLFDKRMVAVWVALLFGIIALATAPLFLARAEEKRMRKRGKRKE